MRSGPFRNPVAYCAIAVTLGGPLAAQHPDTVTLQPVVVTATRVPVATSAVSAAVTILTGADLRARGIRTVAGALRTVPGLAFAETGSYGSQTSVFVRGGESDYLKVLLDGVPQNLPGGSFDFANLTTDNVERIEVVRGPASVLYGSDAVTGVVQIFTRQGASGGGARGELAAQGGTYGTAAVSGAVSGGSRRAAYAMGASHFSSSGVYALNNDYRNTVVSARLRFAPDPQSDVSVSLRHGDDVFHYPTDGAGRIADRNQFQTGRHTTLAVDAGRFVTPRFEARALAGVSRTVPRINDGPDSTADSTDVFYSHDVIQRATIEPRVTLHAGSSIVTVGGAFERESQLGTDSGYGFGDTTNVHRTNRAAYAQLLTGLAAPLAVTLGARRDDNQQFGGFVTYRVGLAWRPDVHTRVRASLGTGFKEPTFFENYAKGFVHGNPDLDPERSRSWEVGVERALAGNRVTAALTWFDQRFSDLIEFTFTPAPPDSVNYFNVAGATARGLEAAVTAALGRGITAALSYTDLRTRVTDPGFASGPGAQFVAGQRLLRRPGHAATAAVIAPIGTHGVVSADARFVGHRDDLDFTVFPTGRVTLPAYTVAGLALRLDLSRAGTLPGVSVDARVDNLFGARYQEAWNFPARGRTLLVGARLRFGA